MDGRRCTTNDGRRHLGFRFAWRRSDLGNVVPARRNQCSSSNSGHYGNVHNFRRIYWNKRHCYSFWWC